MSIIVYKTLRFRWKELENLRCKMCWKVSMLSSMKNGDIMGFTCWRVSATTTPNTYKTDMVEVFFMLVKINSLLGPYWLWLSPEGNDLEMYIQECFLNVSIEILLTDRLTLTGTANALNTNPAWSVALWNVLGSTQLLQHILGQSVQCLLIYILLCVS